MVGHTGKLAPTITAVEILDGCLGRVEAAVRAVGGLLAITADHGNAEQMWDEARGEPHTAHTTNPVPFVLIGDAAEGPAPARGHPRRRGADPARRRRPGAAARHDRKVAARALKRPRGAGRGRGPGEIPRPASCFHPFRGGLSSRRRAGTMHDARRRAGCSAATRARAHEAIGACPRKGAPRAVRARHRSPATPPVPRWHTRCSVSVARPPRWRAEIVRTAKFARVFVLDRVVC